MGKISILPEILCNQIAAGEVVERPAAVVKELVENSIDAQSSKISVSLLQGGRKEIRIIDNGCGMHADDALLALERHATSKIERLKTSWRSGPWDFVEKRSPALLRSAGLNSSRANGNRCRDPDQGGRRGIKGRARKRVVRRALRSASGIFFTTSRPGANFCAPPKPSLLTSRTSLCAFPWPILKSTCSSTARKGSSAIT